MICWCPILGKEGEEDMKVVLNVAGLEREKTKNTNSRKEEIMTNNYLIE